MNSTRRAACLLLLLVPSLVAAGNPIVIDDTVTPPRLTNKVKPAYPEVLRLARKEGKVILQAVIAEDGSVEHVEVLRSSNAGFEESAIEAIRQWRYEPATKDGKPISVYFTVVVEYELRSDSEAKAPPSGSALRLLPPAARSSPIVIRAASLAAVADDVRRVAGGAVNVEQVIGAIFRTLGMPNQTSAPWIDASLPLAVVLPPLDSRGWAVAVLPVRETGAALDSLGQASNTPATLEDGVHEFHLSRGPRLHVRPVDRYLVLGREAGLVRGFDVAAALSGGGLPRGNLTAELRLEDSPGFGRPDREQPEQRERQAQQKVPERSEQQGPPEQRQPQREQEQPEQQQPERERQRQPERQEPRERPEEQALPGEPAVPDAAAARTPEALVTDLFEDVASNVSTVQASVELSASHLWLRLRLLPRASTGFSRLLAAQSGGLPDLARFVDPSNATAVQVGKIALTPEILEAGAQFIEKYLAASAAFAPPEDPTATPAAPWPGGLLASMEEAAVRELSCWRGDFAGVKRLDPEGGASSTEIWGVSDGEACRAADLTALVEMARHLPTSDGRPVLTVTEVALQYRGVTASVVEIRSPQEGMSGAAWKSWLGDSIVMYSGLAGDLMLRTKGRDAENAFRTLVDRVSDRTIRGGITAQAVAPLNVGPGFFTSVDIQQATTFLRLAAGAGLQGLLGQFPPGRVVFGARLESGWLDLEAAVDLAVVDSMRSPAGEAPDPPQP